MFLAKNYGRLSRILGNGWRQGSRLRRNKWINIQSPRFWVINNACTVSTCMYVPGLFSSPQRPGYEARFNTMIGAFDLYGCYSTNQSHNMLRLARLWKIPVCSKWAVFQINFRPQQEIEINWGVGRQSIVAPLSRDYSNRACSNYMYDIPASWHAWMTTLPWVINSTCIILQLHVCTMYTNCNNTSGSQ